MNYKLSLKSHLYSIKIIEKMTFKEYLRNVNNLIGQLVRLRVIIPNKEWVDKILISLSTS